MIRDLGMDYLEPYDLEMQFETAFDSGFRTMMRKSCKPWRKKPIPTRPNAGIGNAQNQKESFVEIAKNRIVRKLPGWMFSGT